MKMLPIQYFLILRMNITRIFGWRAGSTPLLLKIIAEELVENLLSAIEALRDRHWRGSSGTRDGRPKKLCVLTRGNEQVNVFVWVRLHGMIHTEWPNIVPSAARVIAGNKVWALHEFQMRQRAYHMIDFWIILSKVLKIYCSSLSNTTSIYF